MVQDINSDYAIASTLGGIVFDRLDKDGMDYRIRMNPIFTPKTKQLREVSAAAFGSYSWVVYFYHGFTAIQVRQLLVVLPLL